MNVPAHGTRARYVKGCDCGKCVQANTDYHYFYRHNPPPPRRFAKHGEVSKYDKGRCRCKACRAAKAAVSREYYHERRERDQEELRKKVVSIQAGKKGRRNGTAPSRGSSVREGLLRS